MQRLGILLLLRNNTMLFLSSLAVRSREGKDAVDLQDEAG